MPPRDADMIRHHLCQAVERARKAGATGITFRTGDVHKALGLANVIPNVCQVLKGKKLHAQAGVAIEKYVYQPPSGQGANLEIQFRVLPVRSMDPISGRNKEAIRKTITYLEEGEPWAWFTMDTSLTFEHVIEVNKDHPAYNQRASLGDYALVGIMLGLEADEVDRLFLMFDLPDQGWYTDVGPSSRGYVTCEHAIGTLEHLLETGEIDWDAGKDR